MLGYKNQNSSYRSSLIKGNEQSPVECGIRVNRNSSHPSKSNKKAGSNPTEKRQEVRVTFLCRLTNWLRLKVRHVRPKSAIYTPERGEAINHSLSYGVPWGTRSADYKITKG